MPKRYEALAQTRQQTAGTKVVSLGGNSITSLLRVLVQQQLVAEIIMVSRIQWQIELSKLYLQQDTRRLFDKCLHKSQEIHFNKIT